MMHSIVKFAVSAGVLVAVSEIAKRSSLFGALVASLPLTSLLAMVWLWQDTKDSGKVGALSMSIFWLVLPSLVLFVALPVLLKRGVNFYPSLAIATVLMLFSYGAMVLVFNKLGIRL